ncbi:vWA domain-containing protein [Spirillospora sp. CA-253888]
MSEIPGGQMAHRPVHFFWLLDCSGSMSVNGKIGALNFAVREAVPEIQRVAKENPAAQLMVRAITFSSGAQWHIPTPTPIEDFTWTDVHTSGITDLGAALRLVSQELQTPPMPVRALKPVLALVSDGQPTDDWRTGLAAVDATPWGKRAVRVAIAIGDDADHGMLKEFLANPEFEPLQANSPKQLAAAIRWASTVAVKAASTPRGEDGTVTLAKPPVVAADDDADVW